MQLIRAPGEIISGKIFFRMGKKKTRKLMETSSSKKKKFSKKKSKMSNTIEKENEIEKNNENEEIEFEYVDLLSLSPEEVMEYRGNQISMIFQDPLNSLNPVVKIKDQLMEVYLLHQKEDLFAESGSYMDKIKNLEKEQTEIKRKLNQMKMEINELKNKEKKIEKRESSSEFKIKEEILLKENEFESLHDQENDIKKKKSQLNLESNIFEIGRKRAANLLTEVGLADVDGILERYPHELSGGMRQRVMIAMGLSCNPKLLIADEPTTALDVTIQAQILQLMKRLQKIYGTSILMITHDLGLISEMCDTVAVMYSGYIVEFGSIFKLFESPYHPYTVGLLGAIPRVEAKSDDLNTIPGMVPNLIYPPSGCRFHPRCKYCFEPCNEILPKSIEVDSNYYVACHLYDPKYEGIAKEKLK
jgi:oligopeptide/dipeptide ABC transporter ATP-binding protein